jgi:hypothetical protein
MYFILRLGDVDLEGMQRLAYLYKEAATTPS